MRMFFSVAFCFFTFFPAQCAQLSSMQKPFKLGIENKQDPLWSTLIHGNNPKRIGLITNQTGRDQQGARTIDLLMQMGVSVKRIFAPEHGLHGSVQAAHAVADSHDPHTKIPVVSLYGHGTGKQMSPESVADLDLLIFDMQESGMRHYTYISTLLHCMKSAAQHDLDFVVLDRPNPLGGRMEGPVCPAQSTSFIAAAPIPLRHGMTIGELARYFNAHLLDKKIYLHIVPMTNYARATGLQGELLAPLSPNIVSKVACHGYSFLGLLGEVRPCDIGLGTDHAMHCLGLPEKIDFSQNRWKELQILLKKCNIDSSLHRYYRKKQYYRGLLFSFADSHTIHAFDAVITILKFFHDAGVPLVFSQYFDTAVGTSKVQEYVTGTISRSQLIADVNDHLVRFYQRAQSSYLYWPAPQAVVMQ